MKLHHECYKSLHEPTEHKRKTVEKSVNTIKKRNHPVSSGSLGMLVFALVFLWLGWMMGMDEDGALRVGLWLLAGIFLYGFVGDLLGYRSDLKLVKNIENGEYKVAEGRCCKIYHDRNIFKVCGAVGNVEMSNIIFYTNFDTVKAMPGEDWDFMLVSAGKSVVVIMETPDGQIHVDNGVRNMATYPYVIED